MIPILFQDQRFVVLDKPAGLPVHAGPRGGRSVEDWFPELSRRRDGPWLAHRLDADTSGCLVIALRKAALLAAQAAFAGGSAVKTYWAVVAGGPPAESGVIEAPLIKRTGPDGWRMRADPSGLPARTEWRVLGRADGLAWLELQPRTGRTHQVRVHCAALGCPVLGDPIYGPGDCGRGDGGPGDGGPGGGASGGLRLLARAIALPLDPALSATAPPDPAMQAALRRFSRS